jgi:ABC-type bacteriocin/lantibiotic exporter with double-glycine peptidase domain
MNELPKQYQTTIGERGIRLSGGQRQRIGIARALYHNPQVLILDEATSALDNLTEQAVMDAVNNLGKNITIILIAHRLSTVKNCDRIFLLENGKIINEGTFEELIKINDNFRKSVSY